MQSPVFPALSLACFVAAAADMSRGPVEFRAHVIENNMPGGYSVIVADINNDHRPDVIGMTSKLTELAWYENPTWERHVMVKDMDGLVNLAAADVDGDGIPEVAIQNEFSMVAAKSPGLVWVLRHQGDPRGPWQATKVDQLITSHHVAWADVDGDGRKELINAPLIGPKGLAPRYDQDKVSLVYYRVPTDYPQGEWKRLLIDEQLHGVLHRARVVKWIEGKRDQILTAGFDGIVLHSASGTGENLQWQHEVLSKGHEEEAPRAGTSDVAVGRLKGKRILAAVEPWHGNEVVVYTQSKGTWQRRVIFSDLKEGHEVCVGTSMETAGTISSPAIGPKGKSRARTSSMRRMTKGMAPRNPGPDGNVRLRMPGRGHQRRWPLGHRHRRRDTQHQMV